MLKKSIGIRAIPDTVYYSIIENNLENFTLIECSKIKLPKAMEFPQQLHHLRTTFLTMIKNQRINCGGLRLIESNSRNVNHQRLNIEGVFQELIAGSNIEKFVFGQIATICSKLNIERKNYKKYINNELDFELVANWENFREEEKDSIFAALAALRI